MKAQVKIYCAGSHWQMELVNGVLNLPRNTKALTGKRLVEVCNKHQIKIINRDALRIDFQKQLKY